MQSRLPSAPTEIYAPDHREDASPPPKRHRPRASRACDACKTRKTRCDGRQPICRACEKRGLSRSCTWNYPRRRDLKRNLQTGPREAPLRLSSPHAQAGIEFLPPWPDGIQAPVTGQTQVQTHIFQAPITSSASEKAQCVPLKTGTLAAVSDGLATLAGDNDTSLYGASSTIAFVRNLFPAPSRRQSPTPLRHGAGTEDLLSSQQRGSELTEHLREPSDGAAVLPLRRSADNFVSCYWEFIHPLFPVLHKSSFLRHYERLWTGDHSNQDIEPLLGLEEIIFASTLNLVFALGCKFSNLVPPAQRSSVANNFYQRSRKLLLFEILDSTSLSLVQAMLLTGVYLQSTEYANRCWNSVGVAIRVAQSLGLHLDKSGRTPVPQLEREMRRRVWHTCVNLDRLLAMSFGRPTMLSRSWNVPIPALIDDEYLSNTHEGNQPEDRLSALGLFVSSCKLFDLLEEILNLFYSGDPISDISGNNSTSEVARQLIEPVLHFNRRLDRFIDAVPTYLRISGNAHSGGITTNNLQLQQQVLYSRFLYVRLLSLRPLLMVATKGGWGNSLGIPSRGEPYSLDDEVIRQCCALCANTASRLIETIYSNLHTMFHSSGWHSVYFTFSSATVLLAACKCPSVPLSVADPSFEATWTKCLQILRHYEEQISSAAQAINVLDVMKNQVSRTCEQDNLRESPSQYHPFEQPIDGVGVPANSDFLPKQFDSAAGDPFAADSMSDAWFAQQLLDLDWMELPSVPPPT